LISVSLKFAKIVRNLVPRQTSYKGIR
jgi:hypothetical protein